MCPLRARSAATRRSGCSTRTPPPSSSRGYLSHPPGILEYMFEGLSDWDLIEVMGEATRDESTAIAQRLAAVAALFVRRSGVLADCQWWCADGCDAVAAEIAAVQRISHARAVGQVQFACALWHRLPAVAKVFSRGTIDFRVVSTIISRTDNVDEEVIAGLEEAIARDGEEWMRVSGAELRDGVDQWVAERGPRVSRITLLSCTY